jgi:hypothetical protein
MLAVSLSHGGVMLSCIHLGGIPIRTWNSLSKVKLYSRG